MGFLKCASCLCSQGTESSNIFGVLGLGRGIFIVLVMVWVRVIGIDCPLPGWYEWDS